ncbi:hypothetical protein [Enterobacter sp. RHBSTW-00975]|uniref:hypothetical protein n=1 Tax=Enterobacter sp. RHBSTW-00975 TaxID=2742673 RepID=UPI0015E572FA|nr:hypothetical protein [Enterobacter sp. RHBSTW-00975]QLO87874.1 hypothetical protein HV340_04350 [Enterobacter sp. RHBSTW-00975]
MSTLTKESIADTIEGLEHLANSGIQSVHIDMAIAGMRRLLASLEAEPVGFIARHKETGKFGSYLHPKADWFKNDDYEVLSAYTAPPAPEFYKIGDATMRHIFTPTGITDVSDMQAVFDQIETVLAGMWQPAPVSVPDEEQCKPHPVMAVKGELGFLDHFDRIISERDEDIDIGQLGSSNYEALMLAALDAFRAAMFQGAEQQNRQQNIPENIPATQFKPVADLYGLTSPTGSETSFTFDAVEARDFIDGGWSCQEYVELERFQEAITNHTEDKLAMVDHSGDSNNMVEPVTTAYKFPDDFDFDRFNDVVWLETVASNPHMHSPTTSTIAMVALELNRKLAAGNSPVIPDGWVMVPVEPTEDMIVNGFESEPDESFSDEKEWEAYEAMSGCQQAAHRAKLCWAAMIAAAPQQEVK